jgi:CBS domain containing-hemolysin-like protein
MFNNILLLLTVTCCIILGGLFSGSETGLYQLSRIRLRLGIQKKQLPFVILGRCMRDSSGLLLSLLIGNNLVNYLATSLVTSSFLTRFGAEYEHRAELFATLLMVPILFIFSELIPKNIFLYRADVLTPYFSPLLYAVYKTLHFSGILPVLKFLLSFFARLIGIATDSKTFIASAQRHKIQAILHDTHEEGFLSPVQNEIVNRLVGISHVHLSSVMIPIHNVEIVDVNSDNSALLKKLNKCAFTRLPVNEGRTGNIIGFINIYEALNSSGTFADLRDFVQPIRKLDADMTVIDATNIMQKEKLKIVLVSRAGRFGGKKPVGIVTMKDLVEELLGELAEW